MTVGEFYKHLIFLFSNKDKNGYNNVFKKPENVSTSGERYDSYFVYTNTITSHSFTSRQHYVIPSMHIIYDKKENKIIPVTEAFINYKFKKQEILFHSLETNPSSERMLKYLRNFIRDAFNIISINSPLANSNFYFDFKNEDAMEALKFHHFLKKISIEYFKQFILDQNLSLVLQNRYERYKIFTKLETLNFENFKKYIFNKIKEHKDEDLNKYKGFYMFSIIPGEEKGYEGLFYLTKINRENKGYADILYTSPYYDIDENNLNYNKVILFDNKNINFIKEYKNMFDSYFKKHLQQFTKKEANKVFVHLIQTDCKI